MGNPKPISQSELLQWAVLKTATQSEDAAPGSSTSPPVTELSKEKIVSVNSLCCETWNQLMVKT